MNSKEKYLIYDLSQTHSSGVGKLNEENGFNFNSVNISVAQVNKDAPIQMRLLCKFSSSYLNKPWDEYEDEFKTLA